MVNLMETDPTINRQLQLYRQADKEAAEYKAGLIACGRLRIVHRKILEAKLNKALSTRQVSRRWLLNYAPRSVLQAEGLVK